MSKTTKGSLLLVLTFVIVYSIFVTKIHITFVGYSDIIVGTTFFFTLFIGYFITRQNDRYSSISDQLTSNDGYFSYLYRITSLVPRIQNDVRTIIYDHYTKIVDSKNLAYHIKNPSNTLTKMTAILASITEEENNNPAVGSA